MSGRRAHIAMAPAETAAFLTATRSLVLATLGPSGRPHLVAMWFALDGDELVMWSYAKSQKVRNLERDARVTCLAEDGDTYGELRGVQIEGTATLQADPTDVQRVRELITMKYGGGVITPEARSNYERQAARRCVIRVASERTVSWDHRKLTTLPAGVA